MSALHTPIQDLKIGDKVIFWPSHESLEWASSTKLTAGYHKVVGFEGNMVRLECGNIKLLAKKNELKKYESETPRTV